MIPIILASILILSPCIDNDLDGVCIPHDCDDNNPEIYYLQEFYLDEDHDGYGTGPILERFCWGNSGYYIYPRDERSFNNKDCHDLNEEVNPAAQERCDNNIDDNCDGIICSPHTRYEPFWSIQS